jgi:hypothetical protein
MFLKDTQKYLSYITATNYENVLFIAHLFYENILL